MGAGWKRRRAFAAANLTPASGSPVSRRSPSAVLGSPIIANAQQAADLTRDGHRRSWAMPVRAPTRRASYLNPQARTVTTAACTLAGSRISSSMSISEAAWDSSMASRCCGSRSTAAIRASTARRPPNDPRARTAASRTFGLVSPIRSASHGTESVSLKAPQSRAAAIRTFGSGSTSEFRRSLSRPVACRACSTRQWAMIPGPDRSRKLLIVEATVSSASSSETLTFKATCGSPAIAALSTRSTRTPRRDREAVARARPERLIERPDSKSDTCLLPEPLLRC